MKLSDLVKQIGGELKNCENSDYQITSVCNIQDGKEGGLTYLIEEKYKDHLKNCQASALIVPRLFEEFKGPQIIHKHPQYAFAKVANLIHIAPNSYKGVSDQAYIDSTATLGKNVTIYPFVYIGPKCVIEDNVIIKSHVFLDENVHIGCDSTINSSVSIYHETQIGKRVIIHANAVIGSDGFGFARTPQMDDITKIPQIGKVVIEDDVEVGSHSNIDRATFGKTIIGKGTKLDSQVHIGHNVEVGEHSIFCGQSGVAGSSKIGNWVILAGQSGVNDHSTVGDHAVLGARSVGVKNVDKPGLYHGFPAVPSKTYWRQQSMISKFQILDLKLKS